MLERLKALLSRLSQAWVRIRDLAEKDMATLWSEYKTPLILFGSVILTIKFRQWLIDLIVSSSKKLFENAQKQDQALQNEENKNSAQADALVKEANDLPSTEKPVDENWYKK